MPFISSDLQSGLVDQVAPTEKAGPPKDECHGLAPYPEIQKPSSKCELKGPRPMLVPVARCVYQDDDHSHKGDQFSDGFMARLAAIPFGIPTDFLLMTFLPPVLTWTWMLLPYPHPDEPAAAQTVYSWWGVFDQVCLSMFALPHVMASVAGVRRDWYVEQKLNLWAVLGTAASVLLRISITQLTGGIFPVPMASIVTCAFVCFELPFLWFCIPPDQRGNQHFRIRGICAVCSVLAIVCFFGIAFPMMNVAALNLPAKFQAIVLLVYMMVDLGFDRVGDTISHHVGEDVMPCLLFAGTVFFEFNLNVAFAGGFDPLVFVEGILLDLLKNTNEIYTLVRLEAERKKREACSDSRALERVALTPTHSATPEDAVALDIAETAQAMPNERSHEMYVVGMMILRLFGQTLVPIHFLAFFVVARYVRPELHDLVCSLDEATFQFTAFMIAVNIAMQVVLLAATILFMHRYGFYPLHMLQGLLRLHRPALLSTVVCASNFFLSLQFSHAGNDLQFKFAWVHDRHAKWKCGLQWSTHHG